MRPETLSASSVTVAELCLARFQAENIEKAAKQKHKAALRGSAVHGALEQYVKHVHIDKAEQPAFKLLEMFYIVSFMDTFGHGDTESDEYRDGLSMLKKWYDRGPAGPRELYDCEVLSVEEKRRFPLKTSIGEIPFTYIFDRLDKVGENDYRVVDYKTSVWPVTPDELRRKIQARTYALAVRLMFPQADKVWVEFDMLRHSPVAVLFTKDECRETWQYLKRAAERILRTPDDEVEETINEECTFCVKVATCGAVASETDAGGIHEMPVDMAIERLAHLKAKASAINQAVAKLEALVEMDAKQHEWTDRETANAHATWKSQMRREVDPDMLARGIPDEILSRYSRRTMLMKDFDAMLRDPRMTDEHSKFAHTLVGRRPTRPSLKVQLKKASEDE